MRGFLKRLGMVVLYSWPIWGLALMVCLSMPESVIIAWCVGTLGVIVLAVIMEGSAIIPRQWSNDDYFEATIVWVLSPFAAILIPVALIGLCCYVMYLTIQLTYRRFAHE